ncbi:MAG: hypothetical protein CL681_18505 [Blastopirellula sp.]|nr:hypothetical protein [Blastopirellula sp.]
MSKPRKRNARRSTSPSEAKPGLPLRYEDWYLAALIATLVATPFIPSEGVREGTQLGLLLLQLLILVAWSALRLFRSPGTIYFGWTSLAVAIFLAWQTVSTYVMLHSGNARYALNTLWQWYSFGIGFFLLRQLVVRRITARAVCSVMLGLCVSIAAYGLFQYFVEFPALRNAYQADPDVVIAQAGVVAPAGSPQRSQFENRINSLEPTSTFALTNSLAGCLLPWGIVAVGILALAAKTRPRDWLLLGPLSGILLVILTCFLLTKSRTAWLAMAISTVLLVIVLRYRGGKFDWRIPTAVFAALLCLVALAYGVGGLDLEVLSEASKSLAYRLEYWQGSWGIIGDSPWFGCGPGNFQAAYTQYKLPQASETVADPHSFIFEIWATSGTPGILFFLCILLAFAFQLSKQAAAPDSSTATDPVDTSEVGEQGTGVWPVYAGAIAGVPLAFVAGFLVAHPPGLVVFPCGIFLVLVIIALHRWTVHGTLPKAITNLGLIALLINLLAAGGMVFAGVGQTFWIILAVTLCSTHDRAAKTLPQAANGMLALGCISLLLWGYWTTILPSISCRGQLVMAEEYYRQGELSEAVTTLRQAAAADPFSPEPNLRLTNLYFQQALRANSEQADRQFLQAASATIQLDANSQLIRRQIGNMHLSLFRASQDPKWIQNAIRSYQDAIQHYPNSNFLHAQLAWAYHLAGETQAAVAAARKAEQLDQQMPHSEQQLESQTLHEGFRKETPTRVTAAQRLREILAQ